MARLFLSLVFLLCLQTINAQETLYLRDQLMRTHPGDYIVTAQDKNFTVMLIRDKNDQQLTIEEISIPEQRFPKGEVHSWRQWVNEGAPGNTSWVAYTVSPYQGKMHSFYSHSKGRYCEVNQNDHFLCTLLSLKFFKTPDAERKRVGATFRQGASQELRPFWHPKLVVEGKTIPNIPFTAWRTRWPSDQTELSGKQIDVYLPDEKSGYPAYFPYWLEVSGIVGRAKVRIIDSGSQLTSPKPLIQNIPRT